jgi:PAS domain S-box-containing protein
MSSPDLPAAVPALDALPCGFLQLDAEDRVVQWNQRLERWTRIPRSFAVGRLLPKLFPASLDLARILADTRSQGRPRVLAQQFHRWLIPVPLPSGHISGLTDMQQECHLVPLAEPAGHLAITILDVTPLLVGQRRSQALVAELTDARDRAETSLRIQAESEAQLRDLFDNTSELIQSVADDGRFLFVNAAWHRTLGYSPAELPALLVFDVIAPACQAHCREALQRLVAGEELGTLEVVFRAKDGRLITVEGSLTLRRTAGQPFSTRGIFRDVTARRAAEAGARRLALVAEHTTNLVVITDAAGLIEWVNPAFVRASGYTLAEVHGRKPGALLQGPDKDPATVAFMRNHLRRGEGFRAQVLNYAKDGRPYWAEIDVQPVHNEAGVLIQYIAIQTDITARLQAQAELLSYKDRLELALDAANTCTWESDVVENVLRLDARWSLMRGGEPRPTTNHPLAAIKLVHPDDREATLRHYRECHAGPANNYRIEQRVQTLQGDWIWILSSGRVVSRDATGRATRLIGTNTDITAQKRVEAQLAALNLQLQRMVAERTLQLSESEHRYRRLVGLLPVGVYTCDATGLITYYNDEACRIWGHRPTLGDSAYRYCGAHRLWRPGRHAPRQRSDAGGPRRSARVSVTAMSPSSSNIPTVAACRPSRASIRSTTKPAPSVGAINALSDVTARRQAEAAQRESEQRFRSVFDHSPVIIALLSFPEGRVIELNPAAATAFGITRDEVLGRTSLELAVWADPADRTRYLQQLATTGSVRGFETRMRRRDGTLIHVLYSGSIVTIGSQQFSLNLLLDVSARIASEQARERSLSLLRATLESTADGILVVDDAGHIENFNRHFAELWRLPPSRPAPPTKRPS